MKKSKIRPASQLSKQLIAGYKANSKESRKMAEEWLPIEEEAIMLLESLEKNDDKC